jgi:hypothetical protein
MRIGYATNGDSDDWMYGDTLCETDDYSMTPEIGGADDGFCWARHRLLRSQNGT